MLHLIPASLHRVLYRVAFRVRAWMRRAFKFEIRGVSAVLRDGQGRVLMVRHSYGAPGWTVPGGGRGRNESPEYTVRREMREELGIEIEDLELLASTEETISGAPHIAHIFAGRAIGEPKPDGREIVECRFFAADELPGPLSWPTRVRLDAWFERAGQSSES